MLYNTYHLVDKWTRPLRTGVEAPQVTLQAIPAVMARAVSAFSPCTAKDSGIQVSLFPHFEYITCEIERMCRGLGIPNPTVDSTLLLRYQITMDRVTKAIARDVFVTQTGQHSSLLDTGVVIEENRRGNGQPDWRHVTHRATAPRSLGRYEELLTSVLEMRRFHQRSNMLAEWYVPELQEDEAAASGILTSYHVSGRKNGWNDLRREVLMLYFAER